MKGTTTLLFLIAALSALPRASAQPKIGDRLPAADPATWSVRVRTTDPFA